MKRRYRRNVRVSPPLSKTDPGRYVWLASKQVDLVEFDTELTHEKAGWDKARYLTPWSGWVIWMIEASNDSEGNPIELWAALIQLTNPTNRQWRFPIVDLLTSIMRRSGADLIRWGPELPGRGGFVTKVT